jgi:hypothetical protein
MLEIIVAYVQCKNTYVKALVYLCTTSNTNTRSTFKMLCVK